MVRAQTLAAIYIRPRHSIYYDDIYFINMQLLLEHFCNRHILIVGDLHCRYGNIKYSNTAIKHVPNPDQVINMNGKKIVKMLEDNKDFTIANGFISNANTYDSKFTCYRGKLNSQVDLAISNCITDVILFCI